MLVPCEPHKWTVYPLYTVSRVKCCPQDLLDVEFEDVAKNGSFIPSQQESLNDKNNQAYQFSIWKYYCT